MLSEIRCPFCGSDKVYHPMLNDIVSCKDCNTTVPERACWTRKWPDEEGLFWMWGYRYGKISCGSPQKPELILCENSKIAVGYMLVGKGQFVFKSEPEDVWFKSAEVDLGSSKNIRNLRIAMNREEMVCSFEQSEKLLPLLQLGLESNFYWHPVPTEDGEINQLWDINTNIPILTDRFYPAYCSAELDRMLHSVGFGVYLTDAMKYDPEDPNNVNGYTYDLVCLDPDSGWDLGLSFLFHNGARAKAQGLIWLLDETIVEAKDILL